jgi:hypothetical protein
MLPSASARGSSFYHVFDHRFASILSGRCPSAFNKRTRTSPCEVRALIVTRSVGRMNGKVSSLPRPVSKRMLRNGLSAVVTSRFAALCRVRSCTRVRNRRNREIAHRPLGRLRSSRAIAWSQLPLFGLRFRKGSLCRCHFRQSRLVTSTEYPMPSGGPPGSQERSSRSTLANPMYSPPR